MDDEVTPTPVRGRVAERLHQRPAALEDCRRLVDLRTLQAWPFPGFALPESALESWLRTRTQFPHSQPRHLLLVGYESWNCTAVRSARMPPQCDRSAERPRGCEARRSRALL